MTFLFVCESRNESGHLALLFLKTFGTRFIFSAGNNNLAIQLVGDQLDAGMVSVPASC